MPNKGLENSKRIMQLLELDKLQDNIVKYKHVKMAIMQVVGLDYRTVKKYIKALIELRWINRLNYHNFKITGRHNEESMF